MERVVTLKPEHRSHLIDEGFTLSEINDWVENGLVSLDEEEAFSKGFKVYIKQEDQPGRYISGSGLFFPFTNNFGQLRLDEPIDIYKYKAKYLTPANTQSKAYIPEGCIAVTEGIKDARMGMVRGGVPIGAVAGVSHYKKTLPKGCGYTILFDSDGWVNPKVMLNLINAGLWCEGRIQLIPTLPDYPKGGICEYFKSGYTEQDFQELIEEAYTPKKLLLEWASRIDQIPKDRLPDSIKYMGRFAIQLGLDEPERKIIIMNAKTIKEGQNMRNAIRNANLNINNDDGSRVDWNAPQSYHNTIGYWVERQGKKSWEPLCNFDFTIISELESDDGGGYILKVRPQFEETEYTCTLNSRALRNPTDFKDALQKSLRFQIQVALKPNEFSALLAERQYEYRTTRSGNIKKIVKAYGKQPDGTWVFEDIQISSEGEIIPEQEQQWSWTSAISTDEFIPCPVLAKQNGLIGLRKLYAAAEQVFGENLNAFYLTTGWVLASLNHDQVMAAYGSFPALNLHGDVGTLKSMAVETAFSLVGRNWTDDGMLTNASTSAIYEHLSRISCIPFCWDDPPKHMGVDEFAKDLWNGKARLVRGNQQKPLTSMAFTSNFVIGADQAAAWTRMTRLFFKKTKMSTAYAQLRLAMQTASGSFSELIKVPFDIGEISGLQEKLIEHLPYAHARISQSFSIVSYYAIEGMKLAGIASQDIDAFKQWLFDYVSTQENDIASSGNSIVDFFEKINNLQVIDKVGSWNFNVTEEDGVDCYCLAHGNLWDEVKYKYNPQTYDKKMIKSQLQELGMKEGTRKFQSSRTDISRTSRRCWIIPVEAIPV